MGWKMVYNFLGIDEKTQRNLRTFDQNIYTVYLNIHAVYPNKNHVTTHADKLAFVAQLQLTCKDGCSQYVPYLI